MSVLLSGTEEQDCGKRGAGSPTTTLFANGMGYRWGVCSVSLNIDQGYLTRLETPSGRETAPLTCSVVGNDRLSCYTQARDGKSLTTTFSVRES